MVKKKQLQMIALALIVLSILLMVATKGILMYTKAGPDGPLVEHYYTYLNPRVYLAGGMYFAPLTVLLAVGSLAFLALTVLRNKFHKISFCLVVASFLCTLIVTTNLPITVINVAVTALLASSEFLLYKASKKE